MAISQFSEAVRVAQSVLKLSTPKLKVDGYWGTFTRGAYDRAPSGDKARVKAVLAAMSAPSPDSLTEMHDRLKADRDEGLLRARAAARASRENVSGTSAQFAVQQGKTRFISEQAANQLIREVVRILNNPIITESMMMMKLRLEAAWKIQNGVKMYDTLAINSGGYRGLYQFSADGASWQNASNVIELPAFEGPNGWRDPFYNTLAAGAYALANATELRRLGYRGPLTYNVLYLAHNQGANGAYKILSGQRGIAGVQSREANKIINLAMADAARSA